MNKFWIIIVLFIATISLQGQVKLADKIVGNVGGNIVLYSEVKEQVIRFQQEGTELPENAECVLFDQMLNQKLILAEAQKDSIQVTDEEVEGELDRRVRYFVSMVGSEEKFEGYYGKTILEFKDEFRPNIKELLLVERMRGSIGTNVKITPAEVKDFYNSIPKDSLPNFNAEVEMSELIFEPIISNEQKQLAKDKILEFRRRVVEDDEDFSNLAIFYSEDPGSAPNGGDLGMVERGQMVPEFEAAGFKLDEGEVSSVVETQFGFHIILAEQRKGDKVKLRHILIKPQLTSVEIREAKERLDSVRNLILADSMTFEAAVKKFSTDDGKKDAGGVMLNPQTGSTFFEIDQLDPNTFFTIDSLKIEDISAPMLGATERGDKVYKLIRLDSRSEAHVASLEVDYAKIQTAALAEKKQKYIQEWTVKTIKETYVKIDPEFAGCEQIEKWTKK